MKRNLLLTLMCFFALFGNVRAQETIEIGEDKGATGGYNLPVFDYNQYSISQQIYTEEELEGKTGNITNVSFKLSGATSASVNRTYAVYIKSTDLTAFADGNSFIQLSESDKVFEGQVELPAALDSWFTINFDTPFNYAGGNIMLCVYDKTGTQNTSAFRMFYQYSANENSSIYHSHVGIGAAPAIPFDVSNLSGGTVKSSKNQIKLTFVPADEEPDPTPDPDPTPEPDPDPTPEPEGLTTVEIGKDKQTVGNNYYLPTYDYDKYSLSQQIYLEEEFDYNLGAIHSVSFKVAYVSKSQADERNYVVYMKHTDRDNLTGAYEPITEADKVFEGAVEIPATSGSWLKIPFDKAFDYSGGNVVLCVYDKTGSVSDSYHRFYQFQVDDNRAMYSSGDVEYDLYTILNGNARMLVNQVQFEIGSKPIVKVEPEAVDLGEAMLGSFWTEKKPSQKVSVKTVSTTVTNIKCDNDFFVLPENIDFTANPVTFDVTYDTTAQVDGEVKGNLIVTSEHGIDTVSMTALAYTPQEGDVYELAKEVTFVDRKYSDNVKYADLHDNYFLPRERVDGNANDVVYSFELEEEKIIIAKVKGTNAGLSIYDTTFNDKGGPSNDNSYKGSVAVSSDFSYDFNDGFLIDWVAKDYDGDGYSWENTPYYGVDGTNCAVSYSAHTTNGILSANNVLMTENTYLITENSVLSFDASNYIQSEVGIDHIKVEVSKDGESFVFIEEITPGDAQKFERFSIDLGAKFEELGLEYGDYHIALRHEENDKMYVCVDNIQLSNNSASKTRAAEVSIYAVPYPAGKYYAVAAAESDFTFEMMLVNEDELPLAPTNVVATTIDEFSIELTWNKAQNATSYNIYRNDELVANVKDTTFVDENLTHNTDYCYIVRGYNDILESVPSAKACAKTDKLVLATPENLTAVAESTTSIVLTWNAVEKAAGYNIYWGEDVIGVAEDTTYKVEGLTPSQEYCYMVTAINRGVESFEKSDVACAMTLDVLPAVPTNLKVEATSTSSVVLTWDAAENAKRYYIYSADTLVAKTTYTTYNIVKLEYDTEYCFTVAAVNGETESEESDVACGKTLGDGIEEIASSINIYPNPVQNELFLATEVRVEEVAIYDIYGRQQAISYQLSAVSSIDVADLEAGVYFINIKTENGNVVKRFVKN